MLKYIEIKRATEDKINEIYEIEKESFKFPWSKDIFLYEMKNSKVLFYIAEIKKRIAGYIIAQEMGDELHILNLAVKKEERKKGVATSLIKKLEEEAINKNFRVFYLEVRVSNIPAIKFYKKMGFKIAYTRKGYYQDGEDAYVMVKFI